MRKYSVPDPLQHPTLKNDKKADAAIKKLKGLTRSMRKVHETIGLTVDSRGIDQCRGESSARALTTRAAVTHGLYSVAGSGWVVEVAGGP